jgi:predicted RecB family nuclease
MLRMKDAFQLSASDLVGHLNCRNLTELDLAVANGVLAKPKVWNPVLDILRERGFRHEHEYIEHLRAKGLEIETIGGVGLDSKAITDTTEAMRLGRSVIVQGALLTGNWGGRTDVLLRVEVPSDLGPWSYEVVDTKLSKETKGGAVLQLSLYCDLVGRVQGLLPQWSHVIAPWSDFQPQSFRTDDFAAYYRRVKTALELALQTDQAISVYPAPKAYCDVCRWQSRCDGKRREDDHLSLIAGISKIQITELEARGITTSAALATMPVPLTFKPDRGSADALERVREQARIQIKGRTEGTIVHELLEPIPGFGLARLYEPCAGDIFFDIEGDPFVGENGLEYLFGYSFQDVGDQERYVGAWALSRAQERVAFEQFIDFVMDRLNAYPDLHVYHYASYEPAALKRLMGRYATREDGLDQILRGKRFVGLLAVVRQGLRASVESYSIKCLEPLYGYVRQISLPEANHALSKVQAFLELGDVAGLADDDRSAVEAYNRDDCQSTRRLRDWLETVRASAIADGAAIERPVLSDAAPTEALGEWQLKIAGLVQQLVTGIPDDPLERSVEQHARWILAHTLDWHRREDKAFWWEFFRLGDLPRRTCLMSERVWVASYSRRVQVGQPERQYTVIVFLHKRPNCEVGRAYAPSAGTSLARSRRFRLKRVGLTSRSVETLSIFTRKHCLHTTTSTPRCSRKHWCGSASTWPSTVLRARAHIKLHAICSRGTRLALEASHCGIKMKQPSRPRCAWRLCSMVGFYRSRGRPEPGRPTQVRG